RKEAPGGPPKGVARPAPPARPQPPQAQPPRSFAPTQTRAASTTAPVQRNQNGAPGPPAQGPQLRRGSATIQLLRQKITRKDTLTTADPVNATTAYRYQRLTYLVNVLGPDVLNQLTEVSPGEPAFAKKAAWVGNLNALFVRAGHWLARYTSAAHVTSDKAVGELEELFQSATEQVVGTLAELNESWSSWLTCTIRVAIPPLNLVGAGSQAERFERIKQWGDASNGDVLTVFNFLEAKLENYPNIKEALELYTPEVIYNIYDVIAKMALEGQAVAHSGFDVTLLKSAHQLTYIIRDYGTGIPSIPQVGVEVNASELFSHAKKSGKADSGYTIGGKGIGLANLNDAVRKLGGTFTYQNPHGGGAALKIVFPLG
ncbi:MAG TPA: ATP-binding protein, partial [Pyrinomonadaceae bacterium]